MPRCTVVGQRPGLGFAVIATVALMVAASAPSPFYPRIAEQLGLLPVATTLVFAIYAFTMLAALLFTGAVSDAAGRRPVVTVGSVLLAVSLVLFWQSGSLTMLLVARALQGLAAGLLIPTLSAMMVDFASPQKPDAAALWNTVAAMTGLGVGAIAAAAALDLMADPSGAVFGSLAAVFALIAALVWLTPKPSRPVRRTVAPIISRLSVPNYLRSLFTAAVPAIIAGWATNGLFLALGATVVKSEFGATTHAQQGVTILLFAASGVLASAALHRRSSRVLSVYGTSALGIGTALSLGTLALHSFPAYLLTVAVMGTGFGTAFMGVLQTLMPRIDPAERAAVMAVIYTVSYLAFGVPTIIAGLLVPLLSLQGAMSAVGVTIVILCVLATAKRLRIPDRPHPDDTTARMP